MFTVTKLITKGFLEGITITETTSVEFEVGKHYTSFYNHAYTVLACVKEN